MPIVVLPAAFSVTNWMGQQVNGLLNDAIFPGESTFELSSPAGFWPLYLVHLDTGKGKLVL